MNPSFFLLEVEPLVALDLDAQLRSLGYGDVTCVSSLSEAEATLARRQFDIGLLDWQIGRETSETVVVKLLSSRSPVVLATGAKLPQKLLELRGIFHLPKPFSTEKLCTTIDWCLARLNGEGIDDVARAAGLGNRLSTTATPKDLLDCSARTRSGRS